MGENLLNKGLVHTLVLARRAARCVRCVRAAPACCYVQDQSWSDEGQFRHGAYSRSREQAMQSELSTYAASD